MNKSIIKKAVLAVLSATCITAGLSGCGAAGSAEQAPADDRLFVATTLFPYYDFVRQIAGNRVRLKLVAPAGMDSHSFEPTPADMISLQEADLLIRNGGAMEHWTDEALEALDTGQMKILTMMDYVDVLEEELVEGMEADEHGHDHEGHEHEDHDHDHEHIDEEEHEEEHALHFDEDDGYEMEIEYDEHIWTSPVNAIRITEEICNALCEADPEGSGRYRRNTEAYQAELRQLDAAFRQVTAEGRHRMIVVADKVPFRYLAETYGLSYRAAFSGCSTDTEPGARTIAYLIDRVRENDIKAVYYLELSSHRTAQIIEEETGAAPMLLHSCHNVTRREFDEGVTYLQLMKGNVEALRQGLK